LGDVVAWLTDGSHWRGPNGVPTRTLEHLELSASALLVVCALALPLAFWLGHIGRGGTLAINITNVGRAVPVFAVLILLAIGPVGLGVPATVIALVLFGLPPVLTNAYVGVREVDRDTVEAARAMGMTGWQVLRKVELPLSVPLVLNGVRLAAVQIVATATLGAFVLGGGLGRYINSGFARQDQAELVSGALLVATLALLIEGAFELLQRRLDPVRRAGRTT
jgi:osmoprotectant transport system permease protein